MNPYRSSSLDGVPGGAADDSEVMRVLDGYLSRIEAGQPPDPDKLLADHPALAGQLRAYLRVMSVAGRLAKDSHAVNICPTSAPPCDSSPLSTLELGPGPPPHIHLLEIPDEREPLLMPRSAEMPGHDGAGLGRYQLHGEIARGGMGAILRGRDVDLGRELAIKVLLDSHQGNSEIMRRFVEEAQIGGQLQHPGVVPVYELGTFPDRRPFFAMKLVKGRTLSSLLHDRTSPDQDLPRYLSIFEQICQTMAYAHARGVIHRDLKPSNVMVGSFGEVQVMDWGLAKVLPRGGIADEGVAQPIQESVVTTVRSGSAGSGSESQAGSVLGTPAYMAPEQARGEVERIDERADVFGLGAILCEILTGRPPNVGSTREEIRDKAARGDQSDALGRLAACRADSELLGLARDCLEAERQQRPRNADEVSRRLTAYLSGVQERLKAAELARVEAQTRAEEAQARATIERSRRLRTVALAASVLVTAGVIGGGWTYLVRQRTARLITTTRVVTDALTEAERLRGQAQTAPFDDLTNWSEALGAAQRARDLLAQGEADGALSNRVAVVLADLARDQAAALKRAVEAERDRKLLAQLETIRGDRSEHLEPKRSDAEYAAAFRGFGIDLDHLDSKQAGKQIAQRSAPVELASYLDDWALQRRQALDQKDAESWRRLFAAAQAADPDPWRVALRDQIGQDDRDALLRLAADQKTLEVQPAPSLVLFASALAGRGDKVRAEQVLRRARRLQPGDFWVNFDLGAVSLIGLGTVSLVATRPFVVQPGDSARFFSVAVAIRPRSSTAHMSLGTALFDLGKVEEAIAEYREALRLGPEYPSIHNNLGNALRDQGKVEEAIAEFREALRIKPDFAVARNNLGNALLDQGKTGEAIAEYHEALRLKLDYAETHCNLGIALKRHGKIDEAIAEFREALRIKSDSAEFHVELGGCLCDHKRDYDGAITEFRTALRLKPGYATAHRNLGIALTKQQKFAEAVAEFREALRIKQDYCEVHNGLGVALLGQRKVEEAIAEFREALRIKPDYAEAHYNLGNALEQQGKPGEAIAEFREAVRLKPDYAEAHCNLGNALRHRGKIDEAIAEYREALRIKPGLAEPHNSLGSSLCTDMHDYDGAITEFRTALRLDPELANAHANLGVSLAMRGEHMAALAELHDALRRKPNDAGFHHSLGFALERHGERVAAIAEYREALRLKPDDAVIHYDLGVALERRGALHQAVAEYESAIHLRPDYANCHYALGNVFMKKGELDKAATAYREALQYNYDNPEAHCNLGHVLRQQGRFAEALAELKKGHELGSKNPGWQYPSAQWVRDTERLVQLERKLPAVASGQEKPADFTESLALAGMCYNKQLHGASARLWAEAFRAQPKLADDMNVQNRYKAGCAAALAGAGEGKDDPPLDDAGKVRWRKQATDWLKADLAAWSKISESGPPQAKQAIAQTLEHWKADADLAGLRDAAAMAKLPEDEQKACRVLWIEVDALLATCRESDPKLGK
jgi:eukaryotic-like serine/threonine-protein kinase